MNHFFSPIKIFFLLVFLMAPTFSKAVTPVTPPQKAVMVGDDEDDLDACGGLGKTKAGAIFYQLRDGVIVSETLPAGQNVSLCDESGNFSGVVIGENCGVSSPIKPRQPYKGPCKSGWILSQFIEFIAG